MHGASKKHKKLPAPVTVRKGMRILSKKPGEKQFTQRQVERDITFNSYEAATYKALLLKAGKERMWVSKAQLGVKSWRK